MFLVLLFVSLAIVLLISWMSLRMDCMRSNVPGPTPLPLLGNALLFLGNSTKFLKQLQQLTGTYGGAFRVHLFADRYMVFNHPKYIETLVSSTELITKGRSYNFLKPWLGEGLLTATGNRWKTHRKLLTPAFHFNILQNFLPVFSKNAKILTEKLYTFADGREIDLFPIIALTALDNVTESIMGVSVNAQNDSESKYVKAIKDLTELIAMRMRNPFIANDAVFNLLPYKTRQDKALKILNEQTNKVIEARREELKRSYITSLPAASDLGIRNKHAFLDLLLLTECDGKRIEYESIREEVDTFMFEGHDTTTSAIVFCLYCISQHRKVQENILMEQWNILGDDAQRELTYSDLQHMKYLELVIKESLRLYPSVPLIERLITKDTDIAGFRVLKNTSLLVNILQMHRSPDVFENPLAFLPERFETTNAKSAFSWLSFSAGPRNCIGQKFAMMEIKVTLARIVRHFVLSPSDDEPELCADLILRSRNGVHVKMVPRLQ